MPPETDASFTPDQLRDGRQPQRVGRKILVLPETHSTNRVALEEAVEPDMDGLAVFTDYQTSGRGRKGREWLSPRGASVLCSVLLIEQEAVAAGMGGPRPQTWGTRRLGKRVSAELSTGPSSGGESSSQMDPTNQIAGWLTLASAVAACEAIRRATDVAPAIKWPNDLRVTGRKLGGILIESRAIHAQSRAWVIGIGLNCLQQAGHFPPELKTIATSLDMESNYPIDRTAVARELLRQLDHWLAKPPNLDDDTVHQAWLSYAEPIGQHVHLRQEGRDYSGRTLAVDPACGLIVQCDDGTRTWFDPMLTTLL